MHRTDWLASFGHPSSSADFSLPNGIYFLLEFLPELKQYGDQSLQDRLTIYFWWEAIGARCYPDLRWTLRAQDIACLEAIDDRTLCTSFTQAIGFWLRHENPSSMERSSLMRLLVSTSEDDVDGMPKLPYFLRAVIRQDREDLQRDFNLDTPTGRLAYLRWWETHGAAEYTRVDWSMQSIVDQLSVLETSDGAVLEQPRMLGIVWRNRAGLRQNYPINTLAGQLAYFSWWQEHGTKDYPTLKWSPSEVFGSLLEPEAIENTTPPALPRLLNLVWKEREDLHADIDRATFRGQLAFVHWWQEYGQANYPEVQWSADGLLEELSELEALGYLEGPRLPRFLSLIWDEREDLQKQFDRKTHASTIGLVQWWNSAGCYEYPLLHLITIDPNPTPNDNHSYAAQLNLLARTYPFGVNIIGFPQGILGLAEDARMMGHALELGSVPRTFINAPMAGPDKLDTSVKRLLVDEPRYRISVFCLPPPEMMRLALEGGRKLIDSPTYKIGAWPWELPHWPTSFSRVHQFVDEIWAQSKFVQATFSKLGNTPVHHMPMAVEIPAPTQRVRERFGLPNGDFMFYLMFDGNSWLTRKNPLAGVQAFQKAFDATIDGVGLVIKGMNIREPDPIWQRIRNIALNDRRIHIISEKLSRQDSINFMASCDAYISLHRSEGFGRVIAEAMLLGQPVVVTNFSGNVDYCNAETAFLVNGELVPLFAGDYLFHDGQYWCDPDVSQAAEQIRRVFEDVEIRTTIASAGQRRISENYSIDAVSRRYIERISTIEAGLQNR